MKASNVVSIKSTRENKVSLGSLKINARLITDVGDDEISMTAATVRAVNRTVRRPCFARRRVARHWFNKETPASIVPPVHCADFFNAQ